MGKILFAGLLAVLPLQIGRHFWPSFSYVLGLKIDYLAITVYLQSFLTLGLIVSFKKTILKAFKAKKHLWLLAGFFLLAGLNIFGANLALVALFSWLKIFGFVLLIFLISQNQRIILKFLPKIIPFWLIGESFLSFWQLIDQSSVGGLFWYLGERSFNIFTPGIAKATFLNKVFLRPYATFSHPNSLAGFILVSLILLFIKKKFSWWDKLAFVLGLLVLGFCFSRTIWLTTLLCCLAFVLFQIFFNKEKRKFDFIYFSALAIIVLTVSLFQRSTIEANSFTYRTVLVNYAVELIKTRPLLGVGANNFIIALSKSDFSWQMISFLQPVHNIFLLVGSEIGILGLSLFSGFLILSLLRAKKNLIIFSALLVILFTGLFDHYWLSLIQNYYLFALVLGLAWSKPMVE